MFERRAEDCQCWRISKAFTESRDCMQLIRKQLAAIDIPMVDVVVSFTHDHQTPQALKALK
jgi:N-acetylmuramic acid 6-phosphate (MurNAc-6-P) etherase